MSVVIIDPKKLTWTRRVTQTVANGREYVVHRAVYWTGKVDDNGNEVGFALTVDDSYGHGFFATWQRLVCVPKVGAKPVGQAYKGFYCPTLDAAKLDACHRAGVSFTKLSRKLAKEK